MTRASNDAHRNWLARHFGLRVGARRNALDLTQAELAQRLRIHPVYLGRIEAGRFLPSFVLAVSLARALGVALDELIEATA